MQVSLSWWAGFNLGVLALVGMDLFLNRGPKRALSFAQALGWSVFWVVLAVGFGAAIALGWVGGYAVPDRGPASMQFFTAFSLEESLSLDNVFVWVLIFRHFQVSAAHQRGVLSWGAPAAMVMRAVMILGGVALAKHFHWVFYLFGAYLVWAAFRMWQPQQHQPKAGPNPIWNVLQRWVPTTEENANGQIFTCHGGRWCATPLLAVLLTLELTDVTFAFDSVPAVVAVTRDSFLAFTSNIFAVLGLRALFFLLNHVIERCWLLHYALALLLGFIGLKMLLARVYEPPLAVSLGFIILVLAGGIAGSWLVKPKSPVVR